MVPVLRPEPRALQDAARAEVDAARPGRGRVFGTHRISATEYGFTITYSFRIGHDAYWWIWNACSQDTEAENGMGLPGHHSCGTSRLPASLSYTG